MKALLITLLLIFLLIGSISLGRAFSLFGPSQAKIAELGQKVVEQADQAYGKKFALVEGSGEYTIGNQSYNYELYPLDDKSYKVEITTDSYGKVIFSSYDPNHYKEKEWQEKYICPYIDKVTKDNTCGSGISIGLGVDSKDYNIAEETLNNYPTYMQMIEHSTRGLQVGVRANVKFDITPQNILNLMTAVYKIGKFLDKYKFYQIRILARICNPRDEVEHCTYWGGIRTEDWSYMPNPAKRWIKKENIKNWQSPLDLADVTRISSGEPLYETIYVSQSKMWPEIQKLYKEQQT
ncbi:hypothetical protein [Francisella philomiragia]|uniref:hypothetical protein n=2 Tax=Francisella philomiragia TaxID=28110 RepID=UPI00190892C6|nr:hypothetical protein [Francisella philomiragia]MBK2278835.1 hypothetical protein [Francisella philomiragia]MBK2286925.1 hypothetical protein [Francisella philomiragia]MBK2288667.1 hypothetical protein [Francisella philomiragia]MBK2290385.1 hypothetical protein [Francisella philomiragia]